MIKVNGFLNSRFNDVIYSIDSSKAFH